MSTANGHGSRAAGVPATLALTALSVVTAVSLCRVFADWAFLRPVLVVVIGLHAVALALRLARAPLWLALPALTATGFELLALVLYGDTTAGPFPTGRTVDLMRIDLRVVREQFAATVAPVPGRGAFVFAAALALGLGVILADTFAFRAFGRVEAVVPSGVLFVFVAALGTDRNLIAVAAAWIGAAMLTVALLRFDHDDGEAAWMGARRLRLGAALPAIAFTVGAASVAAAAFAPSLPGAGSEALIDTRHGRSSVTQVLDPLVDIRARLVKQGDLELFTVESSAGGHYWRMISLPEFDGSRWEPPDEVLEDMGDRSADVSVPGQVVLQRIFIEGLAGSTVPAAYYPVSVNPAEVLWAPDSDSLVLPDNGQLQRGDEIAVGSLVPAATAEELRAASTAGAPATYYELPDGVPRRARELAAEATAGATTAFDKALALQNWFRTNFEYDANVQLGNSNDAIDAFLRQRAGFCQQFAGTYAVMARALGLPARVAVGFTPGVLGSDGRYHVFGRHAHAWPEVWFQGYGWLAFEPTPGRGSSDSATYNPVPPGQAGDTGVPTSSTTPTTSVTTPPDFASTTVPVTTLPGTGGGATSTTTTAAPTPAASGGGGTSPVALVLLGLAGVLVLWVLLVPRVIATRALRRGNSNEQRVLRAWQQVCAAVQLIGAPSIPGATPLEYAAVAGRATGVDPRTIRQLAERVTAVIYSEHHVSDADTARCELARELVWTSCRDALDLGTRLRLLVDPRLMRRLAGSP